MNKYKIHLNKIYGDIHSEQELEALSIRIDELVSNVKNEDIKAPGTLDHTHTYLIAYGDSFKREGEMPLETMADFNRKYLKDIISEIHILPHFPFSSDDGFSVIDYEEVNPEFGDWDMVKEISKDSDLMFDYVINHISSQSKWFKSFLNGNEEYSEFFVEENPNWDYSNVVRPRTSPLFHEYKTSNGDVKKIWTTFSDDQIDLNFRSLKVLEESVRILLEYVKNGMSSIRLDAIGFLWKEDGSSCIHLEPTHEVIRLWRTILDEVSPNFRIITETNVPFQENISYFGNEDEAHMVYQFPLPPLVAHTILNGNAAKLNTWAKSLDFVNDSNKITFFNFLASHDGIGMRPAEGILNDEEVEFLKNTTLRKGGQISNRTKPDGSESVYELNINYLSLLKENDKYDVERFMASQAILLSLVGTPAIYYNSLLGSENYVKGFEESGIKRRVNREKLNIDQVIDELNNDGSQRSKIFNTYKRLIEIRSKEISFDPYGQQEVLDLSNNVFSIVRRHNGEEIKVIINITNEVQRIENTSLIGRDIISNSEINGSIELVPYQVMWIK